MAQSVLDTILKTIKSYENSRLDIVFSAPALFNGIVPTPLPDDRIWTNYHGVDKNGE